MRADNRNVYEVTYTTIRGNTRVMYARVEDEDMVKKTFQRIICIENKGFGGDYLSKEKLINELCLDPTIEWL